MFSKIKWTEFLILINGVENLNLFDVSRICNVGLGDVWKWQKSNHVPKNAYRAVSRLKWSTSKLENCSE